MRATAHCRWLVRRDVPRLIEIANGALTEEWLLACLRRRTCVGQLVERADRVCGFMVYELKPRCLELLEIHTDPVRDGVGTLLIDRLKYKAVSHRRPRIVGAVPEGALGVQLFLRARGFKAVAVEGDLYHFSHTLPATPAPGRLTSFLGDT